jgi:hypothetical protein
MSCIDCPPETLVLGANPANIHWNVVRGDTAKIRISFFESNESTSYNTEGWTYKATAYSNATNTSDELQVIPSNNYVDVIASPEITDSWGEGFNNIVAELSFDLEVTIPAEDLEEEETIWTPVIGTISVMGDVTRGL